MVTCKLNKDLLRSNNCGFSLPEVVMVYLANHEDISSIVTGDSSGCTSISGITMETGTTFYAIEPAKGSGSFEDTLETGSAGNKYRHAQITFTIPGTYDSCKVPVLESLSLGKYFVVVKTAEGEYLGFGRIAGVEAETATLAGGSDNNGMQVVLSGNATEVPYPLTSEAIAVVTGS